LPNIGKAMAGDLRLLGINHPRQLIGKDPFELHRELCPKTGTTSQILLSATDDRLRPCGDPLESQNRQAGRRSQAGEVRGGHD